MSDNQARVSVRILEKEYHITCPLEERSDLLDSAESSRSERSSIGHVMWYSFSSIRTLTRA